MAALAEELVVVHRLPAERGGWWHEYVCPVHGVELDHVGLLAGTFPDGGVPCRYGCTVDSPAVRGAWYVLAHQACARRIRLLAHKGNRTQALALLTEYARRYTELTGVGQTDDAPSWMLRGRLFHQALTEAIWAVSIGHAVWTLAEQDADGLEPVLPLLDALTEAAATGRAVLLRDGKFTSNYTAWLNAAGAVTSRAAALVRGTQWAGETWLHGDYGVFPHVLAATRPDGWEWEGSTYYHGFVLRAALLALRGTDPAAWPVDGATRLRAMTDVLAVIAIEDGTLPALHDGPYARPPLALEWLELTALAEQAFGDRGLAATTALACAQAGSANDGLELLLDDWFTGALAEPPRTPEPVTVFADAGYAVVHAHGIQALLDFGPHGGSHGHLDKLALYLYGPGSPWQPDPGQVPYGHRDWREHYRSTDAHPAFSVDGADQAECAGTLVRATADTVVATADGCYPGVYARRMLAVGSAYLLDVVHLVADWPRTLCVQLRPDCDLEVRAERAGLRSTWSGARVLRGLHHCTAAATPLLSIGPGPADDPQRGRTRLDWTVTEADTATFCSVYQVDGATPVSGIRVDADGTVVVTLDGRDHRHPLEQAC